VTPLHKQMKRGTGRRGLCRHSPLPLRCVVHDGDRAGRVVQYGVADRAETPTRKPAAPARPEHDELGAVAGSDEGMRRPAGQRAPRGGQRRHSRTHPAQLQVRVDPVRLPALVCGVLLGVLCFTALGLAVVALLRSATSLIAVTLGILLPLSFISDVFVVGDAPLPGWLSAIADVFPLKHLAQALLAATGPAAHGTGFAYGHLAIVAAWTVAGLVVVRLVPLHRA
jgi:hypothetical protein